MSSPAPAASANCVQCRKLLDSWWSFCPFCGADNRDPSLHQTTPVVHAHDFRFGSHCILCGVLVGNVSAASMDPVAVEIGQELVWACGPQGRLVTIAIGGFLLLFAAIPLFLGIQAITTRHAHFVRSGSFHEPRGIDAIIAGVPVVALGIVLILGGFFLIFLPVFMKSRR